MKKALSTITVVFTFLIIGSFVVIKLIAVPALEGNRWVVTEIRAPQHSSWRWQEGMDEPVPLMIGSQIIAGERIALLNSGFYLNNAIHPAYIKLKSAHGRFVVLTCEHSPMEIKTDKAPHFTTRIAETLLGQQRVDSSVLVDQHGRETKSLASRGYGQAIFIGLCETTTTNASQNTENETANKPSASAQQFFPHQPLYVELVKDHQAAPFALTVQYRNGKDARTIKVNTDDRITIPANLLSADASALEVTSLTDKTQSEKLELAPIDLDMNISTDTNEEDVPQ